jgi:hypothetical protein
MSFLGELRCEGAGGTTSAGFRAIRILLQPGGLSFVQPPLFTVQYGSPPPRTLGFVHGLPGAIPRLDVSHGMGGHGGACDYRIEAMSRRDGAGENTVLGDGAVLYLRSQFLHLYL